MDFNFAQATAFVGSLIWPMMRIGAMLLAMPVIGTRLVPTRAKIIITLVLSVLVLPLLPPLPQVEALYAEWLSMLAQAGAQLVDPIELNFSSQLRDAEFEVLLYEFKAGIEEYLAQANTPIASLAELVEYNESNATDVMPHFGQELFEMARIRDDLSDVAYVNALGLMGEFRDRLKTVFAERALAALVAPYVGVIRQCHAF